MVLWVSKFDKQMDLFVDQLEDNSWVYLGRTIHQGQVYLGWVPASDSPYPRMLFTGTGGQCLSTDNYELLSRSNYLEEIYWKRYEALSSSKCLPKLHSCVVLRWERDGTPTYIARIKSQAGHVFYGRLLTSSRFFFFYDETGRKTMSDCGEILRVRTTQPCHCVIM